MADNYLERKMEEYRSGKAAAPRRRLIPSGARRPEVTVPVGDLTVLVAGIDEQLVKAFADAGARVRFCNTADEDSASAGRKLAEKSGAQYFPFDIAAALRQLGDDVDFVIARSDEGISLTDVAAGTERIVALENTAGAAGASDAAGAAPLVAGTPSAPMPLETLAVLFCTPMFASATATIKTTPSSHTLPVAN